MASQSYHSKRSFRKFQASFIVGAVTLSAFSMTPHLRAMAPPAQRPAPPQALSQPARIAKLPPLRYSDLIEDADKGLVSEVQIVDQYHMADVTLKDGQRKFTLLPANSADIAAKLTKDKVNVSFIAGQVTQSSSAGWLRSFAEILLLGTAVRLVWHFARKLGMSPARPSKKTKVMSQVHKDGVTLIRGIKGEISEQRRIRFTDVAGIDEARADFEQIVDFLKNPKKYTDMGAKIPSGALMVGPPGVGKTLLAKAIAGEAGVPFFTAAGSEFSHMHFGQSANLVRNFFAQARAAAPCLVFIDELESLCRARGPNSHEETDRTLTQLLVEMDGMQTNEGVIVIGATNREDMIDPAAMRPGRFSRRIHVSLPDVKGRQEILEVHAKKVRLNPLVKFEILARATPGFSGAQLADMINEAAISAVSAGQSDVGEGLLIQSRDRIMMGRERNLAMTEKEKEIIACHEAGHALLMYVLSQENEYCQGLSDPLHQVTILPRGPSLGAAYRLPVGDSYQKNKAQLEASLIIAMGGRAAEEIIYGSDLILTGATGDIEQATKIATSMVAKCGMSEKIGMVAIEDVNDPDVKSERKVLIDKSYKLASKILKIREGDMRALMQALLQKETLDAEQAKAIIEDRSLPVRALLPISASSITATP